VHGLQGISTVSEADLGAVNDLVEMLLRRGIKAVFVESSVPAKNIGALIEGCAARGHRVGIGGELFSDAMGPPGTPEGHYVGMIEYNVNAIVEALK
jgi:manganese/zinc/iron transport system substrate-binding protein